MSRGGYAVQKTVNAVLAVLSVVLFFLAQPLIWRFRLVDWWTVLFVLLCGTALAMLIWKQENTTPEEIDKENMEDLQNENNCITGLAGLMSISALLPALEAQETEMRIHPRESSGISESMHRMKILDELRKSSSGSAVSDSSSG